MLFLKCPVCLSIIIFETSYHDSLFVGGSLHGTGVSFEALLLTFPSLHHVKGMGEQ